MSGEITAQTQIARTPAITAFSLHLQWASVERAVEAAAEAGFDGIAWAVREGAHITPGTVATELPRVVRLTREAGLQVPEIVTAIMDATSPSAELVLATAKNLGISYYRASSARYDYGSPVEPQLDEQRRRLETLAQLNAKLGMAAMFHTQSYNNVIGSVGLDLWSLLREHDPALLGLNFDIGHIMCKLGAGWREVIRIAWPYVHAVSTKDYLWDRHADADDGEWPWYTRFVAPGSGMVDFDGFFKFLAVRRFTGPLVPYFEYTVDVPGAVLPFNMNGGPYGKWTLPFSEARYIAYMKRDVEFHRSRMRAGGF